MLKAQDKMRCRLKRQLLWVLNKRCIQEQVRLMGGAPGALLLDAILLNRRFGMLCIGAQVRWELSRVILFILSTSIVLRINSAKNLILSLDSETLHRFTYQNDTLHIFSTVSNAVPLSHQVKQQHAHNHVNQYDEN